MSQDTLTLLLPVLWAIISTLIALLLYRTSSAFFSQEDRTKTSVTRLRLTGSVVIAALSFYGMYKTTPSVRLQGSKQGTVVVPTADLRGVRNASESLDRAALEIQGCAATLGDSSCQDRVRELKQRSSELVDLCKHLGANADKDQ